jgi:squalene cyclase
MIEKAIKFLLEAQNPDGGWGATHGRKSNTEATALSLLALRNSSIATTTGVVEKGLAWLVGRQHPDGSWPLSEQVQESSWMSTFAVLAAAAFESHHQYALKGAEWLIQQKGRIAPPEFKRQYLEAPQTILVPLDPTLEGWAWVDGAYSWVEPTSYSMLVLKKLAPSLPGTLHQERIHNGELLLYDRMCKKGGWNYGNPIAFGEELKPYPDTTAVALIALQDHQANEANQKSLAALHAMVAQVHSGLTLSWAILCSALYGQDVSQWQWFLTDSYGKTGFLGETRAVALALLALQNDVEAFRV